MRLFLLCICALFLSFAPARAQVTPNYTDWWWNSGQGGTGYNVGHQGNQIFIAWFGYGATGAPTWFVFSGTLVSSAATGTIYTTTGTPYTQTYNPAQYAAQNAGSGTITFTSATTAAFVYALTSPVAVSVSVNLNRYTFGYFNISTTGVYLGTRTNYSCGGLPNAAPTTCMGDNSAFSVATYLYVTQTGTNGTGTLTIQAVTGSTVEGNCTYTGNYTQVGTKLTASGTYQCSGTFTGNQGNWTSTAIGLGNDHQLTAEIYFPATSNTVYYSGFNTLYKLN